MARHITCDRCDCDVAPGEASTVSFVTSYQEGQAVGEELDLCRSCLAHLAQRLVSRFLVTTQARIAQEVREYVGILHGQKAALVPQAGDHPF